MGIIMALDYGSKRVGVAVTDSLQMIASGLTTVHSKDLIDFIKEYDQKKPLDCLVVGEPIRMGNLPSKNESNIQAFLNRLKKVMPELVIKRIDERFTSKMAVESLVQSGVKKMKRRNKALIDEVSATIILQYYLNKNKP